MANYLNSNLHLESMLLQTYVSILTVTTVNMYHRAENALRTMVDSFTRIILFSLYGNI